MSSIEDKPNTKDRITIETVIPNQTTGTVFQYWVNPELLSKWWPENAEIEPVVDGKYYLGWENHQSRMPGTITHFREGKELGFTWKWDHDPEEKKSRAVLVEFLESGTDTILTITHEQYEDTEDGQKEREDDLGAWGFFLLTLQNLLSSERQALTRDDQKC
jgi:uncharacterized protein YndB with AHSA1/START domain